MRATVSEAALHLLFALALWLVLRGGGGGKEERKQMDKKASTRI